MGSVAVVVWLSSAYQLMCFHKATFAAVINNLSSDSNHKVVAFSLYRRGLQKSAQIFNFSCYYKYFTFGFNLNR